VNCKFINIAVVVADRQQETFAGTLGIGQRVAGAIDHPADRHRIPLRRLEPHLAEGRDRRRHVHHDGRLLAGRYRHRDRVGAKERLGASGRRQMVIAADREIEPDHVVCERHHGVERRRPGIIAHARPDPSDARVFGLGDCGLGGKTHDQMTHGVVAVHEGGRSALLHDPNVRTQIDAAGLDAPHVERQAEHPVGIGTA
jgi:hypothetical protein